MNKNELIKVLKDHKKWLNDEDGGIRADLSGGNLSGANLCGVNLSGADLSGSDLNGADLSGSDLSGANLSGSDLNGANLRGADLSGSDLSGADLRGSDIDFSCWPLWCGSLGVKIDKKIFTQLIYHVCRAVCDDEECKNIQASLAKFANGFHRVVECGKIKEANHETPND